MENQTVTEFILAGFTDVRWLQILLFFLLLVIYLLTLLGNLVIIAITLLDHRLQTPMYFLLRNFSVLEIALISTSIPRALFNLASGTKLISWEVCFAQCFFYVTVGTADLFLLASMSFDRYVAICKPLHYASIMSNQLCTQLVLGSWITSFLYVIVPFILLARLPFCGPNIINHFYCDSMPVVKLACTDTQNLQFFDFLLATGSVLGTFSINITSYIKIFSAVLRISSTSGRQKAFSTCISHLIVVTITYSSCIFMYLSPTGSGRMDLSKMVAVFNHVVGPLLNPFIYSLRNKQVKEALKDTISQMLKFVKGAKM
ncbi:olfactory receptor 6C75-like [Alligator mississippiensis]|uniref:olfactory receptor 6C75-like n=1 Tax=Alligator mississippiensis TaxID=8496 RepID=UPI0009073C3A|nr:olfactory receptor 6C75-like [Alligator mississippiensis]